MKLISLITRLSSIVTIVHGRRHTSRYARQAENNNNNNNEVVGSSSCLDTSAQCATWKEMNLCGAEAVKNSCPVSCDNCENIGILKNGTKKD
jgi:hypothetical protein